MPPSIGNSWVRSQLRVSSSMPPARTTGVRWVRSSEIRVRWAPSEARTRRVSSTISPRIASASRIAVTRAAISRRVRSVSARREVSSRDRPSSRISSALWMAIVARSARAARSAPSCSLNRPTSAENTASVPSTTASPISGANAIDRMPTRSKNSRCGAPSGKRSSAAYSAVTTTRRSRIARWTPDPPTPSAFHSDRVASSMPASCAQWTSPVAGSRRSMTAPDDPSSRAASSTTSWSSSAGSWIVIIRRAISRSARSASAVRSRAPCEVARRSTSRALASATEAWPASASSSRSASSPNASRSRWPAWNTPTRPSSPTTGAVMTECRSISCTPSSPSL